MIEATTIKKRFDVLQQWYQDSFIETALKSSAGVPLRMAYRNCQGARGTLIIVSGRTEFIEKYLEVCRDLSDLHYSVCVYDHCGQGGSGRLLDDPEKGHIDRFDTYAMDLSRVIERLGAEGFPVPVTLVGHSMGATIATLCAQRYPEKIIRLLLCSPMCGIHTGVRLPDFVVKMLVSAACRLGLGKRYAPTTGPYKNAQEFTGNKLTSDRFRYEYNRYLTENLSFAALGGPTIGWLNEAFHAMKGLQHRAEQIAQPVLTLAAAGDQVIDVGEAALFTSAFENSSFREYPVSGHELLMERDEIRSDVLSQIKRFLSTIER